MATRGVKITGLNPLGGNLDANTILVTVDPNLDLTLQTNVQDLGNFILGEAGNLFPEANVANTVRNNAQPNITSLGTLVSLTVGGNANVTGTVSSDVVEANTIIANQIIANIITAEIANGTSNINIPSANGNITVSVSGNANIATFTGTGVVINGISDLGNVSNVKIYGGSNRSILQTDGNGNLSWGPDVIAAGPNMAVQFNDEGNFGGSPNLIYNKTTDTLTGVNIDVGNALGFAGPNTGKVSFIAANTANNVSFVVPDYQGTKQQVLGIIDQGSQVMGWKTIPVYYITIELRDGNTYLSSPNAILRQYPIQQRDGTFTNLNTTQI